MTVSRPRGSIKMHECKVFFKSANYHAGYDWVGWKKRSSSTVNLVFTFDKIRRFSQLIIHTNNHFTRDSQVFKQAKIYFSNEEDKFGDDRYVDFKYMPDLMLENARNVSINLEGEHGKYVMVQLYFAAKWILVSEVTFISGNFCLQEIYYNTYSFELKQGKKYLLFS